MGFGRQLVAADAYPASPLGRSVTRGFAVELYLDTALENQILRIWNVLPSRKLGKYLIETSARPHVRQSQWQGNFIGYNPKDQPSMADVAKWLTSWVGHHKPSA
ncbi:unnamed protein product [Closterium sp. NIES-65]|nr:unnamed protein product [Closterium sp. NIES-65]